MASLEGKFRSTTVVACRRGGTAVMAADGQVSLGPTIMKAQAKKVRRLSDDQVLAGFAGATADAFALLDRFESKLREHGQSLMRAAVELGKDWRTDRYLRKLEAMMIVMDRSSMLLLSGTGDIIEPDEDVVAIGSGGPYALSAARALQKHTQLDARELATEALTIAGEICVYTNGNIVVEELT